MKLKKETLAKVIIIVLLLLVLITYIICYKYKQENNITYNNEEDNLSNYHIYIYNDNTILKTDEVLDDVLIKGKYSCTLDDCDIYENTVFNPLYDDRYIVIKENNKVFIYDYIDNTIVSNSYDSIYLQVNNYFFVANNDKYGIITIEGDIISDTIYDDIGNIYNDYIKVGIDNLYGVYDLKNKEMVIDITYEDIRITDSNYFSILDNNMWYVINKNKEVITSGYEYTYAFNKGFIAKIDNSLYILKYSMEQDLLNDNTITIDSDYDIKRNNNIIYITIGDKEYQYEINRNELLKK